MWPRLHRLLRCLYGDALSRAACVQSAAFAALLCLVVGVYWMMRSLKDSIFAAVVGLEYQPRAKLLSLLVVTALLLPYGVLVERLTRQQLFACVAPFSAT